jgi:hypothetical protein
MSQLLTRVPAPDPKTINTGVSPCPTSLILRKYGYPVSYSSIGTKCASPNVPSWEHRMVTKSVGPFKVTGHRLVVEALTAALAELHEVDKELYDALGTAGMLCVRWVRGRPGVLSNHGLGCAIDFTILGHLDVRGDGFIQAGLLRLYAVLKKYGFYWGVEFGIEDAMHFEMGGETVLEWIREGIF